MLCGIAVGESANKKSSGRRTPQLHLKIRCPTSEPRDWRGLVDPNSALPDNAVCIETLRGEAFTEASQCPNTRFTQFEEKEKVKKFAAAPTASQAFYSYSIF
jgi:hypothetical protein